MKCWKWEVMSEKTGPLETRTRGGSDDEYGCSKEKENPSEGGPVGIRTCLWTYPGPLVARQEKVSAALLLARSGSVPQKLDLHLTDQAGLESHRLHAAVGTSS